MRILLINPPYETDLSPGSFPLGLGYISSVLVEEGHKVKVLDIKAHRYSRIHVEEIISNSIDQFDVIGISGLVTIYSYIKWLAETIKKYNPSIPIVVGGSIASSIPELLLSKTRIDIACIGEGEITVKELIKALEDSKPLKEVKGIYFKQDGNVYSTPPRGVCKNLDSIPFPKWDLFPIELYVDKPLIVPVKKRSMNIIFGRGCPFHCTFCYRNFGNEVRLRSPDNVIEEMTILKEKYHVTHFEFQDELFTVNEEAVKEICEKILDKELNITWRCLGRVNMVDLNLLKLMKRAGCNWIGFGIESGSQKMLDVMRKNVKVEQIKKAIELARKAGMEVTGTFIIGMPGETRETVKETVNFCKEMGIYNEMFFPVPYPGTQLYVDIERKGLIKDKERFILSIGKDMTNLIINLTDFPDHELIKMKKEAEEEILRHLETKKTKLRRRTHSFTVHQHPFIDNHIENDLNIIAKSVLEGIKGVISLILVGGFGRGEGSVLIEDGIVKPLNDYDIVLVTDRPIDQEKIKSLTRELIDKLKIRLVDLIPIEMEKIPALPPTQFNYDMKYGGYCFWGEDVLSLIPEYLPEEIPLESGKTVLFNRMICLLECYSDEFKERALSNEEKFFLYNQCVKAILACSEALLIKKRKYHHSYIEREKRFEEEFPGLRDLIAFNRKATAFKLRPTRNIEVDGVQFWARIVSEYVNVLSLYLKDFCDTDSTSDDNPLKTIYSYLSVPPYIELSEKELIERLEIALLSAKSSRGALGFLFNIIAESYLNQLMANSSLRIRPWEEMRKRCVELWFQKLH